MRTFFVSQSRPDATRDQLADLLTTLPGFAEPVLVSFEAVEGPSFTPAGEVAIVFLGTNSGRGHEILRRLRQKFAGPILAVGGIGDAKAILRTMQVGADLYLDEADLETEFTVALGRLLNRPESSGALGHVLAVVSASGGTGVSTLAVNLAVALAREHVRSLLIDLNPGRGDLAALLDLKPPFTLTDVCANEARLDQAMFEKMLARHASGVSLLGAPVDLTDLRGVTPGGMRHALALARALFPDIVVDLEDCLHAEQLEILKQATTVMVVCRLDFTSLRGTRRLLDHLARLGIQRNRVRLVVNQHAQPGELPIAEAEAALGDKVGAFVPYDPRTVNAANNTGVPVVLKDPTSKVAQAILALLHLERKHEKSSGLIPNLKHLFKDVLPLTLRSK